ncbi:Uncharacterised protein [Raoultella ornithinolytica]|nr:Uncharacterised protein [Raoultella ornithinolytica]
MHVAAEVNQRRVDALALQVIAHPVGNVAFGNRPKIDLHSRLGEKNAACGVIEDHILWAGQR